MFDHVDQLFGIGTGATFSANNNRPGEIIREANNEGVVQLTVQNTGSGATSAGLQFTITNTPNANANLKMNNNPGTNPSLTLAIGSVSPMALLLRPAMVGRWHRSCRRGSAAGATANPFIALVKACTVATPPSCTSSLAGALAYVTNASSPTYNASHTGESSVKALALCNGSVWTAH